MKWPPSFSFLSFFHNTLLCLGLLISFLFPSAIPPLIFCFLPVFSVCVSTVLVLFLSLHSSLIRCLVAMLYPDSEMYLGQATDITASQYWMSETKKRFCTVCYLVKFEVKTQQSALREIIYWTCLTFWDSYRCSYSCYLWATQHSTNRIVYHFIFSTLYLPSVIFFASQFIDAERQKTPVSDDTECWFVRFVKCLNLLLTIVWAPECVEHSHSVLLWNWL